MAASGQHDSGGKLTPEGQRDHMSDVVFYVKAFIALLVLVNPLEGIPIFLSATRKSTPETRAAIARRACLAVTITLLLSAWLGNGMLRVFGVSVGAFQLGGGAVLFLIAVKMVFGSGASAFAATPDGEVGPSFGVVPLAIPLMAGPGAITGAILYGTRTHSLAETGILAGIILLVGAVTLASLRAAGKLAVYLKDTGITVATSVMGLVIAAIAVEMMVHGIALMFGLKVYGGASSF